jgi:hypothetical protein
VEKVALSENVPNKMLNAKFCRLGDIDVTQEFHVYTPKVIFHDLD